MNIGLWVLFMANAWCCWKNLSMKKPVNTFVGMFNGFAAILILTSILSAI